MEQELTTELTAEEFLNAVDVVVEIVPTPELKPGSFVYARSLTGGQRSKIDGNAARFKVSEGKNVSDIQDFNINLVFWGACNAKGDRLFTDIRQVDQIKKRNAAVISRIAETVAKLSGLSKDDLKDLEKNSLDIRPEDSPSA